MDMDSQLPLTIYCCLVSKNSQLKPIISLIHDYFESEDEYESENRVLAALKVKYDLSIGRIIIYSAGMDSKRPSMIGGK